MKKLLLSGAAMSLCLALTAANYSKTAVPEEAYSRQCCSKTYSLGDGNFVEVTACAGWFLSDDAAAMTRACAKVDEAVEGFTN